MHNVVITGLGIISSLGLNVDEHSRRLLDGDLGIKVSKLKLGAGGPPTLGAGVEGFRARDWIDEQLIDGTDGFARFAMAAATQAIDDAGIGELDPLRTAIVHGTSMGGTRALLEAQHLLETPGPGERPAQDDDQDLAEHGGRPDRHEVRPPRLSRSPCARPVPPRSTPSGRRPG